MELETDKIVVVGNPRKDFGDMDELTASIREKGVLEPLLVNSKNELIAGGRRLKAAIAAGLKKVPVKVVPTDNNTHAEIQLIENIQRKDLNPVEEGEAFRAYLNTTKHSEEHLAKKIGKKIDFIQRRLSLAGLEPTVKKALKDKKIKLGHAVIMSRYKHKRQKTMLSGLQDSNWGLPSIEDFATDLDDNEATDMDKAKFDKKECTTCIHNGGCQTLLTDTDGEIKDLCLNPICFRKKQKEYVKTRKTELESQNANVMDIEEIKKIPDAREVHTWNDNHAAAKRSVYNSKNKSQYFAVAIIIDDFGNINEEIWRIAEKKQTKKELSKNEQHNVESSKSSASLQKLKVNVKEFKHELLRKSGNMHLKGSLDIKRFLTWSLFVNVECVSNKEEIETLKKITEMTDKQLDTFVKEYSEGTFQDMHGQILEDLAAFSGADLKQDFEISEEYLQLYTKDQLIDLAAELKIPLGKVKKNAQIIEVIKQGWKKGQVPKILAKRMS